VDHSLAALREQIEAKGGRLDLFRGKAHDILLPLVAAAGAGAAFWTRRYGAAEIAVDTALKAELTAAGVKTASSNGQLPHEPWEVRREAGGGSGVAVKRRSGRSSAKKSPRRHIPAARRKERA
jgi:deoxyribodipyrimidine photo-lyase